MKIPNKTYFVWIHQFLAEKLLKNTYSVTYKKKHKKKYMLKNASLK